MSRITFGPPPKKPIRLIARNPVYQAFAKAPMPKSLQITQSIDARLSYANTVNGQADRGDRKTLAGVANCVMVLAEKYCIPADLAVAQQAQMALLRNDARVMEGGKTWQFDTDGQTAMLAAIELFEDMAERFSHGMVCEALVTVMERAATGQVHKVEVSA